MKTIALLLCISFAGFAQNTYNLIPLPKEVVPQTGQFVVKKSTNITYSHPEFAPVAELLQDYLQKASAYPISTKLAEKWIDSICPKYLLGRGGLYASNQLG